MTKVDNIYKTKDIFEASFLHSKEIPLLKLESGGHYFWFVFSGLETCESLSSAYWSGTASGNIKDFVNSYKTVKDLVFSRSER